MRKQALIGGIIVIAAIILAYFLVNSRSEPEEKPAEEIIPLVQVVPIEIRSGNLTITGSGNVRPRQEVNFAAQVAGKLIYVNPRLSEGQGINKGEILFRIEPNDFQSAVDAARADVASQNVAVVQAREEALLAQAEIARFEERAKRLAAFDGGTQILTPDALSRPNSATNSATNGPTNGAANSANNLATRQPQLDSARAALRRAQAQLSDAQTALGRTVVRAPFSGIVRSKDIALGSFVQPGQSLGSIVGSAEYEAVISLSEKEAALIDGLWGGGNKGADASVFLNYGGTRYRWQATVDRASSILNPQTRTIDIFLRIRRPINGGAVAAVQQEGGQQGGGQKNDGPIGLDAPPLFVGSFIKAEISGKDVGEYAILPLAALRPDNQIWLVEDGKLRIFNAQILQRGDKNIIISARGLGQNPIAVTSNLNTATQGEKVRIAKPNNSPQKPVTKPAPKS